ncbi:MAG: hypothetical protein IJ794_10155 [Lachnospiraceae bacterium]|nr:hypothetical protein [Lachnospiraceae bacterium]
MKYNIPKINRTVELDDALVKEYEKYDELTEHSFIIGILSTYNHKHGKEDVSDEELSELCNKILASDIEAYRYMPRITEFIEKNSDKLDIAAERSICLEVDLGEKI